MEKRVKHLPIGWLVPNIVTMMALCSGLTAIKFAMTDRWELAYWFIIAAIVMDGMDGRLARLLKSSSTFGAQLDSLSDFLSFGVAPAIVLYLWTLHDFKGFGWASVLFFAVCGALRLARFNTALFDKKDVNSEKYFTGVPAPVGAALALFPMILSFQFANPIFEDPRMVAANLVLVGALMASRIPTISIKKMEIRIEMALPAMLIIVAFISMLIIEPWLTIAVILSIYYVMIPIGLIMKTRKNQAVESTDDKVFKLKNAENSTKPANKL